MVPDVLKTCKEETQTVPNRWGFSSLFEREIFRDACEPGVGGIRPMANKPTMLLGNDVAKSVTC